MDLQTLFVVITVGIAAAVVVRTFTRQFTSRGGKGCGNCAHGGAMQSGQSGLTSASRDGELIQVESIDEER